MQKGNMRKHNGVTHHFDDREELLAALKGEHS